MDDFSAMHLALDECIKTEGIETPSHNAPMKRESKATVFNPGKVPLTKYNKDLFVANYLNFLEKIELDMRNTICQQAKQEKIVEKSKL